MASDILRSAPRDSVPPAIPERPAILSMTDAELVAIMKKVELAPNPSMQDVRLAAIGGKWRYAVWKAEYEAGARLSLVLWAIELLLQVEAAGRGSVRAQIEEASAFVRTHYNVTAPPLPPAYTARRCHDLCVRRDILSDYLRTSERARSRRAQADDDMSPLGADVDAYAFGGDALPGVEAE